MMDLVPLLGYGGMFAAMALSAIGSIIGCAIAGQAAVGAMVDSEGGYGKFIGLSVIPSSQVIYGIVIMFSLNIPLTPENAGAVFMIGLFAGLAQLAAGFYQGRCCAAAIQAAKAKPEIFGISIAPAAIVEGFAVFVLVFAIVLINQIAGA